MVVANTKRLDAAWRLLRSWQTAGHCRAVTAETGSVDGESYAFAAGRLAADKDSAPVNDDSIFLIASPTKPFVATAAMMLVEQGQLQLDHFAKRYLPDFQGGGRESIRLLHLLTHTSGLPDMLPNNIQLRQCTPLCRPTWSMSAESIWSARPGARVSYQSMGVLTLATIVESVTASPLAEFLAEHIFEPLQMTSTALAAPDQWEESEPWRRMAWSQVEHQAEAADWGWNSRYWRKLGAPWGGLLSTSPDLGRFCRHLLSIHRGEEGILSKPSLQAMTTNRLSNLALLPEATIRATPWGLGWQLNWPGHPRGFGSLLPAASYGHWGATGTLVWLDPSRGVYGVVLTTESINSENRRQIAFANTTTLAWPTV